MKIFEFEMKHALLVIAFMFLIVGGIVVEAESYAECYRKCSARCIGRFRLICLNLCRKKCQDNPPEVSLNNMFSSKADPPYQLHN
nr:uncharacterized protein LOC112498539 [Ipomoea batatas]